MNRPRALGQTLVTSEAGDVAAATALRVEVHTADPVDQRVDEFVDLARADVFDYIEVFYNRTRRHSHIGGVSPEAFEQASA